VRTRRGRGAARKESPGRFFPAPAAAPGVAIAVIAAFGACRDVTVVLPDSDSALALPVDLADVRTEKYGVWPFGVHGGGHPEGHGGFDFEIDRDAVVRAAARGVVDRIEENRSFPRQFDLVLRHDSPAVRTSYGHLRDVPEAVRAGAKVERGAPLGKPAWREEEGFAMIHFAVTDPRSAAPFGEVCPLDYFHPREKAALESFWRSVPAERKSPDEPLLCNERVIAAPPDEPIVGTWFARRPREGLPRVLALLPFPAGPGARRYAATRFDGRAEGGAWRREGSDLVLEPEGSEGEERRWRVRLDEGILLLLLGSADASASYDRSYRSVVGGGG